MKTTRIAAGLTAFVMAAGMLSGCGKSEEGASKKSKKEKMTAPEAFNAEIDKLDSSDISKNGSVNIKVIADDKETDQKLSWDNLAESLNADKLDYEFSMVGDWNETDGNFSVALSGTDIFAFGMDSENYYIDLSQVKPGLDKAGLWNQSYSEKNNGYSVEDILSVLKISKSQVDAVASDITSGASVDSMADKVKGGLSDKTKEELKKLADKAEYDGSDIVIKGLKKADVQGLLDAVKEQYKDAAGTDSVPDLPAEAEEAEDNSTVDYSLSYSDDDLDQVHTFVINNEDGNTITVSFGIKKTDGNVDLSRFASSKTVEEITNNDVTFEQLAQALVMPLLSGLSGMGGGNSNDLEIEEHYPADGFTESIAEWEIPDDMKDYVTIEE